MRGIAVIDRQPDAAQIAVWITSRDGAHAKNVNAVVLDAEGDPDAAAKWCALTCGYALLATDGTRLDGLPVEGEPLSVADVNELLDEVEVQQARILDAITEYKRRMHSEALVEPTFPPRPAYESFTPRDDSASQRALATANYVARAWTTWLKTDEERRRRTEQPKTRKTPWIMPEDMNSATVPDFPEQFTARLHKQPRV